MRLSFYTLFLSLATLFSLSPLVHSIHPHALSRRDHRQSPPAQALTSRQYRVIRDLLDVCINANVNLAADVSQILGLGSSLDPTALGSTVQLCLCLKDLDIYLETNDDVQVLVALLGKNAVSTIISTFINTSPDAKQCTFPQNARHICNNSDSCHYECDTNYIRNGDTCVCALPNITCNGVCGSFPQGCGSSVPIKKRAELVRTLAQAKAVCKPHQIVCGVPGRVDAFAFECIDINTTKDSCGGCVVPHPFSDAYPGHQPVGQDCGNISNVKSSACSAKQCIVHSCQNGWLPSPTKEECLPSSTRSRMRRVKKRTIPLTANATANLDIDSGLVSQLVTIVNTVVGLNTLSQTHSAPSIIPVSSSSSSTFSIISAIYSLFNDVNRATGNLLTSSTISEFLSHTDNLLDTSALLNSMLNDCGCIQSLGLTDVSKDLANLIKSVSSMQDWCIHHSIVPGLPIPSSNSPNQPIIIGLTDLLSDPGLNGKSGAFVNGLDSGLSSSANGLLNSVSLGRDNYKRRDLADVETNATINSDLLANIIALVNLIVNLRGDVTSLPPSSTIANLPLGSGSTSAVDVNGLVNSILVATTNILNATTSSSLTSSIDHLVETLNEANSLLGQGDCVDKIGLSLLAADLKQIVIAARDVQSLCHGHPILASPSPSSTLPEAPFSNPSLSAAAPTSSVVSTSDIPIVIGLSDLLSDLGLLGPVSASVTVAGLGSGLNQPVDNTLNGLNIGPANTKRSAAPNVNGTATINSELRSLLEGLTDLVINLEEAMGSLPALASDSSLSSLDATSVLGVARSLGQLLQSKTVGALLANVDAFVDAESALEDQFISCGCVETLGLEQASAYLQLVGEAAVGLKAWCASNSIVAPGTPANPSPTSLGPLLPTGLGPMAKPPIPQAVSATTLPVALPTTVTSRPPTSTSSPASSDIPIVIGLDYLLTQLGLGTSVVTVDGLGDGLDSTVNGLTNGLSIGPDDVRRRGERRQVSATAIANATVDSDLLVQIDALVNLILGLNSAAASLPPAASSVSTPPGTASYSLPAFPAPSSISSGSTNFIDSGFVDNIINTAISLLSSGTYEELVEETDALVSASTLSLTTLEGCGCIKDLGLDSLYEYLIRTVNASLALQDLCRGQAVPPLPTSPSTSISLPTPTTSTSSAASSLNDTIGSGGEEPLVVGLTKLLRGLGIDANADVIVDFLGYES